MKWKIGPINLHLMLVFRKQNFSKGAFVVQRKFIIISYLMFFVPLIFITNFLFEYYYTRKDTRVACIFSFSFLFYWSIFCFKSVSNPKEYFYDWCYNCKFSLILISIYLYDWWYSDIWCLI